PLRTPRWEPNTSLVLRLFGAIEPNCLELDGLHLGDGLHFIWNLQLLGFFIGFGPSSLLYSELIDKVIKRIFDLSTF
ncbi:hypothetical protein ACJX0J_017295, partial [Zea mays]